MAAYTLANTITQVFNVGLLLVISSSKFEGETAEALRFNNGVYADFEPIWYYDIAPLIYNTYMYVVFWPIIESIYMWLLTKLFVWYDQGACCFFCCDSKRTRQTNVQAYVSIHSGPDFDIFNKYAAMMTLVFVPFIHGISMPLLFPWACVGLFILFYTDKYRLAHYYQRPPNYSGSLSQQAINILYVAPLLMVCMALW